MAMPFTEPHLRFEPYGDTEQGLWHLVVLPGMPSLVTSNRPDGSYETKDLFVRYPTDPKKWKFSHRADDIIVLVNGLKADPHLLEEAVEKNHDVDTAMAFGVGRLPRSDRGAVGQRSRAAQRRAGGSHCS